MPFDDHNVPTLDNIARTVVDAQFESDVELIQGDGQAERESHEEPVGGSDDVNAGAGLSDGPSATEHDDSSYTDIEASLDDARKDSSDDEHDQDHADEG